MLSKGYKLYFWFCSRRWLFLGESQLEGTPAHLLALALIAPPENITSCSWPVNKKPVAPKTFWIWICQPTVVRYCFTCFHFIVYFSTKYFIVFLFSSSSFFFFFLTSLFLLSFALWDRIFLHGPLGHKPIVLLSCPLCVWRFKVQTCACLNVLKWRYLSLVLAMALIT